jgi:hypothetical protein
LLERSYNGDEGRAAGGGFETGARAPSSTTGRARCGDCGNASGLVVEEAVDAGAPVVEEVVGRWLRRS